MKNVLNIFAVLMIAVGIGFAAAPKSDCCPGGDCCKSGQCCHNHK